MKTITPNERGQLILPILAVLFLFGLFWVAYVYRVRDLYWKMRTSITADLVAISAARQQAAILNYVGTLQLLQNPLLPQAKGHGVMDVSMVPQFETYNAGLRLFAKTYSAQTLRVAQKVAIMNGSNRPILPSWGATLRDNLSSRLRGQKVKVLLVADGIPVGTRIYPEAYFARTWSPGQLKAQPPHTSEWRVCRDSICGDGRARLWLDVDARSTFHNGGFPRENDSIVRTIGFQCFYPQFNAQLLPKAS